MFYDMVVVKYGLSTNINLHNVTVTRGDNQNSRIDLDTNSGSHYIYKCDVRKLEVVNIPTPRTHVYPSGFFRCLYIRLGNK